ncbi:MAG: thioredoxin domain-containing protein [Planctomycetota bacterium]|nr:thioredoxin domain-containing protein [Planctomycetota bacterium]
MPITNNRSVVGAAVLACAILVLAAAGCGGGSRVTHVGEAAAEFDQVVMKSEAPVLMEFFKQGCAACGMLEPTLDQLAEEYQGRVTVASFMAYTVVFGIPCPEINQRYNIGLTPTVILFVKGQEKKRWVAEYDGNAYRTVLNGVVGGARPGEPKSSAPAAK